jgi:hypothetical protein
LRIQRKQLRPHKSQLTFDFCVSMNLNGQSRDGQCEGIPVEHGQIGQRSHAVTLGRGCECAPEAPRASLGPTPRRHGQQTIAQLQKRTQNNVERSELHVPSCTA